MSDLMNNLSTTKSVVAKKIINYLNKLKTTASAYDKQITTFKDDLDLVDSFEGFHQIVEEIIRKEKEINLLITQANHGADIEIKKAVDEYVIGDKELSKMMASLKLGDALTEKIISTKERLSKKAWFDTQPNDKKELLDQFVDNIKHLKPIVDVLQSQKKAYQERLEQTQSLSELDSIESEIMTTDAAASYIYKTLVSYPEDEQSAGALITFLEANYHVLSIMKAFSFYDALTDDILYTRSRLTMSLENS